MKRFAIPVLVVLLSVSACATSSRTVTSVEAVLGLESVQRPADVAERWGEYEIRPADEEGYLYEDDMLSVMVVPSGGVFAMEVENRTDHSIRLIWDDASYVGPDGYASGVVSGETTWMDIGGPQPSQVVPARARLSVRAMPTRNLNRSERQVIGFFPGATSCADVEGVEARLVMPFEIEGAVNEYTFQFSLLGAFEVETRSVGHTRLRDAETGRQPCS